MVGVTIEQLRVGDRAELARRVTEADVAGFVDAVGDHNPLHSDRDYAATTAFGERIAPGMWTAGLISAVIGTRLPGPGAVYLAQDLRFLKPVRLGDLITARAEVVELDPVRNRARLRTVCVNQRGEDVLAGEALVMPARRPLVYAPEPAAGWLAVWALSPWAWAAQAATLWGMLGLTLLAPRALPRWAAATAGRGPGGPAAPTA
jgi:acyl dehydratase